MLKCVTTTLQEDHITMTQHTPVLEGTLTSEIFNLWLYHLIQNKCTRNYFMLTVCYPSILTRDSGLWTI